MRLRSLPGVRRRLCACRSASGRAVRRHVLVMSALVALLPWLSLAATAVPTLADYRAVLAQAETAREERITSLNASYARAPKGLVKAHLAADRMVEAEAANKELKLVEAQIKDASGPAPAATEPVQTSTKPHLTFAGFTSSAPFATVRIETTTGVHSPCISAFLFT